MLVTRVGTVFSVSLRRHTRSPLVLLRHLHTGNKLHYHLFPPSRSPTAQSLKPSLLSRRPAPCSHTRPTAPWILDFSRLHLLGSGRSPSSAFGCRVVVVCVVLGAEGCMKVRTQRRKGCSGKQRALRSSRW